MIKSNQLVVIVSKSDTELKSAIYLRDILAHFKDITTVIVVRKKIKLITINQNSSIRINHRYIREILSVYWDKFSTWVFTLVTSFPYCIGKNKGFHLRRFLRLNEVLSFYQDSRVKYVNDINSEETKFFLDEIEPKIVILAGCGVIKADIINSCNLILNVHSSILPGIRGLDSEFWALKLKKPNLIGHSLHEVNEFIDDGTVLANYKLGLPYLSRIDHKTIRILNIYKGAETIVRYLKAQLDENIETEENIPYCSSPTLLKKVKFYFGK